MKILRAAVVGTCEAVALALLLDEDEDDGDDDGDDDEGGDDEGDALDGDVLGGSALPLGVGDPELCPAVFEEHAASRAIAAATTGRRICPW